MPKVLLTRPLQTPRRARPLASDGIVRRAPASRSAPVRAAAVTPKPKRKSLQSLAVAAALAAPPDPAEAPASVLAAQVPIDMDLPGEASLSHFELARRRAKWRKVRRVMAGSMAVALVLVVTMGGLLFSQSYLKLHKVFKGGTGTAAALKPNVDPSLLKGEGSGRINILLLGRGGGNHEGPDLTDSMMLASIDPVNHTATLLSLPRDLWVNVPNQGVMKINAAWETGEFKYLGKTAPGSTDPKAIQAGFNMADQTVESVLGINIDYNVIVDFQAFQQAVDTVGGVTVNVPAALVDPTMAWQNGGNATLAAAGIQNFNGAQALNYVRSRETSTDFARAERQRAVLVALKSKVDSLGTLSNPLKLSQLLNTFGNNVSTDLSLSNASRLYGILKGIDGLNVSSVDLTNSSTPGAKPYVTTGNLNGQSIVLPSAGLFQYGAIQQYVRTQLKDPYIVKEDARILVLNGTATPGLGTAKAAELQSYGYNVVQTGNTPSSDWTKTTVIDLEGGKDKYTKHYLEERYNVKSLDKMPNSNIPTNGADFVIIIGSDEANPTTAQP